VRLTDFLSEVGRPLSYYPSLKKITGSTVATIFLTQFVYWTGKQNDPEGWIYKTQDEIGEETGLSRSEQETARRQLKLKGLIEEDYKGLPRKLYYRVNIAKINDLWSVVSAEALKNHNNAGIQHYCMRESSKQECYNPANKSAEIQQTITEITSENTSENTTTTTTTPVGVSSREKEKKDIPTKAVSPLSETDTETVREIIAVTIGTQLEGMISGGAIQQAIKAYNPNAALHKPYQPETRDQGVKRILTWMTYLPAKAYDRSGPAGFLICMAERGMDKPAAISGAERDAAEKAEAERDYRLRREQAEKQILKKLGLG
jgi:DNA-binding transcriptional regulator GbsR (MarR family)